MTDLETLAAEWSVQKAREKDAAYARRNIEDRIASLLEVPKDFTGTKHFGNVKVVGKMTKKVDADKVAEIAMTHGLHEEANRCFRFKAEVISKEEMNPAFNDAIETKPARLSITVEDKK